MTTIVKRLENFEPCEEAVTWLGKRTNMKKAWGECLRYDWLLWLVEKAKVDRKLLVSAACDCAETALKYVPAGEERPAKCIAVTRAWVAGTATLKEVNQARHATSAVYAYAAAADAAAADAAADAAAYAAVAAANAAYAAVAAANAAYAAANAANAAAAYAAAYAAAAAKKQAQKNMCKLIRKRISFFDVAKALKENK